MITMLRRHLAKRSGREKKALIFCSGMLLLFLLKYVLTDIPESFLEAQEIRLTELGNDERWILSRSALVICPDRKQVPEEKRDNTFSLPVLPDTVHEIHSITENGTRSLSLSFSEQKVLLDWLLEIEANYPVRVIMLKINDEMNRADVTLKEVRCHDI